MNPKLPIQTQPTPIQQPIATTEGTHIDSIPELKSSQHRTQQPPSLHDSPSFHDSPPTAIHHTNPSCTNPLHNPSPPLQQTHCTTRPPLHKPTTTQTQCRFEEKRKGRRENEKERREKEANRESKSEEERRGLGVND